MSNLSFLDRIKQAWKIKYQCQVCGKMFDQQKGVNIHTGLMHKEPDLPWDWMKERKESETDRMYQ